MTDSKTPSERSMIQFHLECLCGMYFDEIISREADLALAFSSRITDSYYNIAVPLNDSGVHRALSTRDDFKGRQRKFALYSTPLAPSSGGAARDAGLVPWATDSWMVAAPSLLIDGDTCISVKPIDHNARSTYVDVFAAAYSGADADDPYGTLEPGYLAGLFASFDRQVHDCVTSYLLATRDDGATPVGVACLVIRGPIAGVYGVGTLPKNRGQGVGTALMAECISLARSSAATIVLLQTEQGSRVEGWYAKLGFHTIFTGTYYVDG